MTVAFIDIWNLYNEAKYCIINNAYKEFVMKTKCYIVMWMQEGRNWHFGKNWFSLLIESTIKNTDLNLSTTIPPTATNQNI